MMQFALLSLAFCLVTSAALAQTNWFTPDAFNVTCLMQQRCVVNNACTKIDQTMTIEHNPELGLTKFVLPDWTPSQGVLGVMSVGTTQTLTATTSTDAEKMYRINIYPDSTISVGVMNFIDRPEDMLLYGTCKSPES
jgi:hypothetical protein